MDLEKGPYPNYLERIGTLEDEVRKLHSMIDQLVPTEQKRWYDEFGCVMVWLIMCGTIVLLTMISAGVIR